MIRYVTGNLLIAETEALVNTVNTEGVMGKGIALQFKESFPQNFVSYAAAVKAGEVRTGKMFVTQEQLVSGGKWIINFPTKEKWFAPSRYVWVEEGLKDLVRIIRDLGIRSVAIPPLGCGNGRLKWEKVKEMMEQYLSVLGDVEVLIYSPNDKIKAVLQKENQKKKVGLTTARAELLYLLFMYETSGEETSLFVANKLAYFLQRMGESQLKLRFVRHHFGPYSNQVDHVMYHLNGSYISGLEQNEAKAFERLHLRYDRFSEVQEFVDGKLTADQRERLERLLDLVEGFESPLAMEALATVDSILDENPKADLKEIMRQIDSWSNRKKNLFSEFQVKVALARLTEFGRVLGYA